MLQTVADRELLGVMHKAHYSVNFRAHPIVLVQSMKTFCDNLSAHTIT